MNRIQKLARCTIALTTSICIAGFGLATGQGRVVSWGADEAGILTNTPTGGDFVAVSAKWGHALALRANGSIVAWGLDNYGQVSQAPTGTGFKAIAAGYYHSVAIRADGSLATWGWDMYGQVSFTPPGNDYVRIEAGLDCSMALRQDGSLVSWGFNGYGQVANTPAGNDFVAMSLGFGHSLALRANGTIAAWGWNGFGQVSNTPLTGGHTAIAAGDTHSTAIRLDGTLASWGNDVFGEVTYTPTPSSYYRHGVGWLAMEPSNFVQVFAANKASLSLRENGSLVMWGQNWAVNATPPGNDFIAAAAGQRFGIAIEDFENAPPIADAGPDQTVEVPNDGNAATNTVVVTLDASNSSDPDDDALTYEWRDSNGVVSTDALASISLSAGLYPMTLTVTDPSGLSHTDSVKITVFPERGREYEFTRSHSLEVWDWVSTLPLSLFRAPLQSAKRSAIATAFHAVNMGLWWGNRYPIMRAAILSQLIRGFEQMSSLSNQYMHSSPESDRMQWEIDYMLALLRRL